MAWKIALPGELQNAMWHVSRIWAVSSLRLSSVTFLWVVQIFFPSPPSLLFQSRHGPWSGPAAWWRQLPGPARGEEQTHNQFNGVFLKKIKNLLSFWVLKLLYFCNFSVDVEHRQQDWRHVCIYIYSWVSRERWRRICWTRHNDRNHFSIFIFSSNDKLSTVGV